MNISCWKAKAQTSELLIKLLFWRFLNHLPFWNNTRGPSSSRGIAARERVGMFMNSLSISRLLHFHSLKFNQVQQIDFTRSTLNISEYSIRDDRVDVLIVGWLLLDKAIFSWYTCTPWNAAAKTNLTLWKYNQHPIAPIVPQATITPLSPDINTIHVVLVELISYGGRVLCFPF